METNQPLREPRNPYFHKLKALDQPSATGPRYTYLDKSSESNPGKWHETFTVQMGRAPSEIHLEIGCNAGHVILEWASLDPQAAYIGLDWKLKAIHRAFEKAAKRDLKNITFLRADAQNLPRIFAPGELDKISVFFPDPWAKKSQHKHRHLNDTFYQTAQSLLKSGGTLEIRTDHRGYFDSIIEAYEKVKGEWKDLGITYDKHADNHHRKMLRIPDITLFEGLFIKDNLPIHQIRLEKP